MIYPVLAVCVPAHDADTSTMVDNKQPIKRHTQTWVRQGSTGNDNDRDDFIAFDQVEREIINMVRVRAKYVANNVTERGGASSFERSKFTCSSNEWCKLFYATNRGVVCSHRFHQQMLQALELVCTYHIIQCRAVLESR